MPGVTGGTRRSRRIAIGAAMAIVGAAAVALAAWWSGALRGGDDPAARAASAYDRGDWAAAERAALDELKLDPENLPAMRVLARASARLGRDDAAIALYARRLRGRSMEAEDYTLLGLSLQRRRRIDEATLAWEKAVGAADIPPRALEELARVLIAHHRLELAARAADRLAREPGGEARGRMMLGTVRAGLDDVEGAAESFRLALERGPGELEHSGDPVGLGKLVARTFLRAGRPAEARAQLEAILAREDRPEIWWLLSRAYLQEGDAARARSAIGRAGTHRADHPMDPEPSPYVGEARCESCHARIYRDSLASRHTQSYYRGDALIDLPRPDRPLPDPDDPSVSHAIRRVDGSLRAETRVGSRVLEMVIAYAFGTSDRYLTMVGRDATGGYRIARLSYYQTPEGRGWDRSALDRTRPNRDEDFQGEAIGVRDGVAKCLYCHATNPRAGRGPTGPESADRAIGCERCHGPGAHHLAAVAAGLTDLAIVNPGTSSPEVVTTRQCNDCHILGRDFGEDKLDDPAWARSQGVGWTFSRCNTASGGAFGCLTCHDPHKPASSITTAQYEARCLSCHPATPRGRTGDAGPAGHPPASGAGSRPCPVNPSKDCLGCHMPRVRIEALHLSLTDHYIHIPRRLASPEDGRGPGPGR